MCVKISCSSSRSSSGGEVYRPDGVKESKVIVVMVVVMLIVMMVVVRRS